MGNGKTLLTYTPSKIINAIADYALFTIRIPENSGIESEKRSNRTEVRRIMII